MSDDCCSQFSATGNRCKLGDCAERIRIIDLLSSATGLDWQGDRTCGNDSSGVMVWLNLLDHHLWYTGIDGRFAVEGPRANKEDCLGWYGDVGGDDYLCKHIKKWIAWIRAESYSDYLRSNRWRRVRMVVLKRDGFKCAKCSTAKNLHVHHITYKRLGDEDLDDLISLCGRCHRAAHSADTANA
jgi:5-methylcytosine-specific restriction endonuclease McrA